MTVIITFSSYPLQSCIVKPSSVFPGVVREDIIWFRATTFIIHCLSTQNTEQTNSLSLILVFLNVILMCNILQREYSRCTIAALENALTWVPLFFQRLCNLMATLQHAHPLVKCCSPCIARVPTVLCNAAVPVLPEYPLSCVMLQSLYCQSTHYLVKCCNPCIARVPTVLCNAVIPVLPEYPLSCVMLQSLYCQSTHCLV